MRKLGRPTNTAPSIRMALTLAPEDHEMVKAYAQQVAMKPATVVTKILLDTLRAGMAEDGKVEASLVNENLRKLQGTDDTGLNRYPRWTWPLELLLADRRWWDRLLPQLYELLGRGSLVPPALAGRRPGERDEPSPVSDRRGYSDLLEYLFPARTTNHGVITWRELEYGALAFDVRTETSGSDTEVWEATIRHVAVALDALAETLQPGADALYRIQVQEHITGPWLQTLSFITGKGKPEPLPESRLT